MTERNGRLLSEQELAEAGPPEAIRLPLDLVIPNPDNPRRDLSELDALADNIRAFGLLQPVTVRRVGDEYQLLGGHRRRAAFALLREREPADPQWRTIPAVLRNTDDDDRAFLMLVSSQVHNRDWHPREEAAALERLLLGGRTLKQVGESVHRTEGWASRRLRVYADAVLSGYVQSGKLAATVAEQLLPIRETDIRRDYADRAAREEWSQARVRAEVRKLRLDSQLSQARRMTRDLLEILSAVDPARLPIELTRDLWVLVGAVQQLARGGGPVIPTIEAAQRAAGVNPNARPRRQRKGRRR